MITGKAATANKQKRIIASDIPHDKFIPIEKIMIISPAVNEAARKISFRTFLRYLNDMVKSGILVVNNEGFKANTDVLRHMLPARGKIKRYIYCVHLMVPQLKIKSDRINNFYCNWALRVFSKIRL